MCKSQFNELPWEGDAALSAITKSSNSVLLQAHKGKVHSASYRPGSGFRSDLINN